MCVKFLEDALGQKLPRRPQTGPGEQFTIFQFWSYVEALDSPSMEAYVTETAEEGEPEALITKWPDSVGVDENMSIQDPTPQGSLPCYLVPTLLSSFSVIGAEFEFR